MKYISYLIILFFFSCEQWKETELNLFQNDQHVMPIIEGGITTEYKLHYLRLTEAIIKNGAIKVQGLSDAIISIHSDDTMIKFIKTDTSGIYRSIGKCRAKVGKKYQLSIRLEQLEYEACDTVVKTIKIFDEHLKFPVLDNSTFSDNEYFFQLPKHDFGYNTPHLWNWQMQFENRPKLLNIKDNMNVTHSLYDYSAFFSNEISYLGISGLLTDTINIYKYSTSDNFYNYLCALFSETDWKTSLFSKIPGNLPGNISNNAYGFFYACDVEKGSISIDSLRKVAQTY